MKNPFENKNKIVLAVFAFIFIACIVLTIPVIRLFMVDLTEKFIVHRKFQHPDKGANFLLRSSFLGIFLLTVCFTLYIFMDFIKEYIYIPINDILNGIGIIKKPIIFMFGLYVLGTISILRADFLYIDDLGRAIAGYRGWENNSRYINNFLSVFLHADKRITDISPLPQLLAALFLAVASVLFVYILSNGRMTKRACLVSLSIGLSPYFLECLSYKFDAPYMALSILASVFPFLFVKRPLVFFVISFFSMFVMSMTYQASSGIYVLMVMILCFRDWNENKKDLRELVRFAATSALSYSIAMIVFRLFVVKEYDGYVSTSIYPASQLVSGAFHNAKNYLRFVNDDFGLLWKILLVLIGISFIIKSVLVSKRNKIVSLFISGIVIAAMCVLSFGVYLFLTKPLLSPRGMFGFGVFVGIMCIYVSVGFQKKLFAVPAVALCWCFFVFSFSYGNALSDQKRYNNFRTEILLHDLAMLFPHKKETPYLIKLTGTEGHAPSIQSIAINNPIIRRLVPINLVERWHWGDIYLNGYYNFNIVRNEDIEDNGLEILYNSYYHTIKSDGERILVVLK